MSDTKLLIGAFLLVVLILLVNGFGIYVLLPKQDLIQEPPITILSANVVTPEVKVGGVLEYVLVTKKNRTCRPHVDLMFISSEGDVKTAGREVRDELPITDEPSTVRRRVMLPKSVLTGEWEFLLEGRCQPPGEPWYWPTYHPVMKFTVIE